MKRLTLFLVSMAVWYLLAWPYDIVKKTMDWQIFAAGVVLSIAASLLFVRAFTQTPMKLFNPVRYFWFLCYIPVLFYYMLAANIDVVYRVIHPAMPINPGIVKVRTTLQTESGRTALANSITLTPGTLTVDLTDEGFLYVHCINVQKTSVEEATQLIVKRFEPLLKRIFE